MAYEKLAALAVATVIGAASITPAQARLVGGGGGAFAVAHVGGSSALRGGFVRGPAFVGRRAFIGRPFFPYRRFITPFDGVGIFYAPYLSCWTWVPTDFGWLRVWECKYPYAYGYR
ncbi:MAG TPA: hypothetical protein VIY51_03205 [Xanthobacteraceae bacterium]